MKNETIEAKEKVKGISLRLMIVWSITALLVFILYFLTHQLVLDKEGAFDMTVYEFLAGYTNSGNTKVFTFLTFFGSTKFLLPAYILLALYYIIFKKNNIRSFNIIAIGITSIALLYAVKGIFKRPRPPHPLIENVSGFSYPSGHSFSAFTFCGILIYILWQSQLSKTWKYMGTVVLFLFAASVALSRVYLHVHYASDVIAGFCLGALWLALCIYILRRVNKEGELKKDPVVK